ncbi:hypothetical protein E2C01_013381 [Portunus trituberculatus]|uniref:Uncharacterized protein n=1 Tax=Portunus trituberculatus TaxID=210409 RepID=A0A5B7DGH1_PORTR|nr:hypothetical protein [Portunus trituberculatus]
MSLSGEVVSDCQLDGGCRLILKSSPMGLRLHWLTDEGGKQKTLYGTSCLSTVKVLLS